MSYIYPVDLYKASALNAFLQRGYSIDTAVELAKEAAQKMKDDEVYDFDIDS